MRLLLLALPLLLVFSDDGLQITDLTVGKGPAAAKGDTLTFTFTWAIERGKKLPDQKQLPPKAMMLGEKQAIDGLDQGLLGVKAGGKRRLVVPPEFAFGDKGAGQVPPKATLVFEVDVLKIYPKGVKQAIETKDLKIGRGEIVTADREVEANYTGAYLNGNKFASGNFKFTAGQHMLVPGLDEGVLGMKVGGKRQITVPPDLAFGLRGAKGIPPLATLVFQIEIKSVK